ncbi:hypothetical protein ACFDR9_001670 [Janthinobacterium sp. CG_23.3]|uniref:hypothetical protein n=1 Tax=Janthinobacterium sp. CG_23.3 TaxID=3349634 RepID=UPI0038D3941F
MGIETAALLAYAAVASATVGAGAAIYSGVQQRQAADDNAELARRQGVQEKDAAVAQAEKIRKAARAQAGAANAALAASGVSIGEGTPVRINEEIYRDSESDAYSTLLTGSRRQRTNNDQAGILTNQGNAAMTSGVINAGASLLSAGANYTKWKGTKT